MRRWTDYLKSLRLPFRFVLQLISLAGLHSTATITAELAKSFQKDGMLAYVKLIQRREKELGVDVLTHQKWSGAAYVDGILGAVRSGSSSSKSMGEGNTEAGMCLGIRTSQLNILGWRLSVGTS
jgi:isocitrate lyase